VVFVRDATAIASVPASGGTVSTLASVTAGSVVYPAVSRAGTLAYVHLGPSTGIPIIPNETISDLVAGGTAITSGEDVAPVPVRWLPDGRVLYVGDGAIRVRQPGAGAARDIPFQVRLAHTPPRYRQKRFDFDSTAAKPVRGIATPRLAPDGQQVAFIALNALWLMPAGGRPRRLLASPPQFLLQSLAWARDGGSRSTAAAITIVSGTCACKTSAASPGGMPRCIDRYRKPNWPRLMNAPTAATVRNGSGGRGTRKQAGTATTVNRIAANSSGGTDPMPQSMTTKLKPHRAATSAIRAVSRRFTQLTLGWATMKHQRMFLRSTM